MRRLWTLAPIVVAAAVIAAAQVGGPTLIITNESLPPAIDGQPYQPVVLTTSGDPGPIAFSFDTTKGVQPFGFVMGAAIPPQPSTTGTFCFGFSNGVGNFPPSCSGAAVTTPSAYPTGYTVGIQARSLSTGQTITQTFTLQVVPQLQIITVSLPDANANQTYSAPLQASGGTGAANYAWSILSGSLPPGINLNPATGALAAASGTAGPVNGTYTFTVQLLDQVTQVAVVQPLSINVVNGIGITSPSQLPDAAVGQSYTPFQLQATGSNLVWSVSKGWQLPPNFSLSPGGVITGFPLALNPNPAPTQCSPRVTTPAYCFQIQVANAQNLNAAATQLFSIAVTLGPLRVQENTLPPAIQNVSYAATVTGLGGIPPYTWGVNANAPGLIISNAGRITGKPPSAGVFPITVTLTDSIGKVISQDYSLTVSNGASIITSTLPAGVVGTPYSATLTATTGVTRWDIIAGNLPPGLNLGTTTGQITGTPTATGTFPVTIQVTDSSGSTGSRAFVIVVTGAPLVITSGDFTGTVQAAVSQTLTATGGTPPYTWSSGALPAGLQLNGTTGVIAGTPTAAGASAVSVTVTDFSGATTTKGITITIIPPNLPPTSIGVGTTTQPPVSLTLGAPFPLDLTGVLTLTFASSAGGTDDMVRFIPSGGRTLPFVVPANSTQATFPSAPNAALITGTVAGTITLKASLTAGGQDVTPSPAPTKTITIAPAVPVITSVALTQVTGGLNVVVTGYSNTREVSSGSFTFTVTSGNTLSQGTLTVPLTSAYATWFNSTTSNATGGQFKLTVPFSVTQGSATAVTRVSVTLTNNQGASGAVSSP